MTGVASGPLSGLRVVELAGIGPAPFAAMLLAQLGADVIAVDRPGAEHRPEVSLLESGRTRITIDLHSDSGAAQLLELVASADALIEGYRPGVMERRGVGPDVCLARNPRLVYGWMTGWGKASPRDGTAGHDITYLALSGALHEIGRR